MNLVLTKEKGSLVLPLRFRDLDRALHNFDDGLFSIQSCFPNILYSSTVLIWERQRNLAKTFTGQDRVMKNVTMLYQLNLKWVKAPSLLRNSERAWAATAWPFLNTSCAEGLWMSLATTLNPKVMSCPCKVSRAESPFICPAHGVYLKAPLTRSLCISAVVQVAVCDWIKKYFDIFLLI